MDDWKRFDVSLTIYADPRGNPLLRRSSDQQTFHIETFSIASRPLWNLALSPPGHLLSEYMHYIGFADVLVFPTLMSEKFEISDHGIFSGVQALPIGYIRWEITALLKLILKFRTLNFYPYLNFYNFVQEEK